MADVPVAAANDADVDIDDADMPIIVPAPRSRRAKDDTSYTYEVRDNEDTDTILGRISFLKQSSRNASFSVHCSRHKCVVMKRMCQYPGMLELRAWFMLGKHIHADRDQAHSHLGFWPEPLPHAVPAEPHP